MVNKKSKKAAPKVEKKFPEKRDTRFSKIIHGISCGLILAFAAFVVSAVFGFRKDLNTRRAQIQRESFNTVMRPAENVSPVK